MGFFRRHACAATLLLAVGCSSKVATTTVVTGSLSVAASPATAAADGVSVVAVHVEGTGTAPFRVTTTKGTFDGGASSVVLSAVPADVTLHSCDSSQTTTCAGTAILQVVDANLTTAAAFVAFTSTSGGGSGGGSGTPGTSGTITITTVTSSARIPADGVSLAAVTATVVDSAAKALAGRTVTFAQSGSGATLRATTATSDGNGLATVVLVSDAVGGTATVTATDAVSGATSKVTIEMPRLGQISLASQQHAIQGVRFSGFQETNQLKFQLLDSAGLPYPAGLSVAFSHQSLAESYLGSAAACTTAVPSVCSATGTTDASGQVAVALSSGRSAGIVTVIATATAGGQTASGTAGNIAIVGAKSSGAHITVDCTPKNIPVLSSNDCNYSHYVGPGNIVTCTATFADRFNNVLGVATQATFASEAGAAGPPATTVQYDPMKAPTGQTNLGTATNFINLTGGTLPADVTPFDGEFSSRYTDRCGLRTHNPRDGLVTVIVTANGEEGFVDQNGNGVFDAGEPFIDMGEPYIDVNDNGQWDAGEAFIDLNGNKQYDGPNNVWDGPGCTASGCKQTTVIWAETRILLTDQPQVQVTAGNEAFSRIYGASIPTTQQPTSSPTATFSVLGPNGGSTAQPFTVAFMDGNFNAISPAATYTVGTVGSGAVTTRSTQVPATVDSLGGISFTQQYCDRAPPTTPSASGCSNTCLTSPCYVVTNVGACDLPARGTCTGFRYGSQLQAQVTGACTTTISDTVQASATLNGVTTSVTAGASCDACANGLAACGTSCVNTVTDTRNCGGCGITCGSAQTCQFGICVGGGGVATPYVVSIASSASRIAATHTASATITATVTSSNVPVPGRFVNFTLEPGSAGTLSATTRITTNALGQASIVLTSSDAGGTATVIATDGGTATEAGSGQSATISVAMPQLGQVNLLSQQYQVQGVRYSGYQEANTLTFQLLDTAGQPYPPGLAVSFSHQSLTGSYIGASASCTAASPSVCSADGTTNGSGQVSVLLTSGRTAGVVSVTASATAGALSANGSASNLAIVGAKASGAHISVDCSPKNIPALVNQDCNNSFYSGPGSTITCKAFFADRFNNVLGIATQATFASEAGSAGPPASTPQYDPTRPPTVQTGLGMATDFINVMGYPLPRDVPPFAGEFSAAYQPDSCGVRTHNPRDGLVTIVVAANGEEGFVDRNGNGVYDHGEYFIDMGEPYVDANDNGQYDEGEYFVDLNQNNVYDPPNGVWDGPGCTDLLCKQNTVIWAETRVVYTSPAADYSRYYQTLVNGDPFDSPPDLASSSPRMNLVGGTAPSTDSRFIVFMDANFNGMTSFATVGGPTMGGTGVATAKLALSPWTFLDGLGMSFTQQYCDKPVCDLSIPGARCGTNNSVPNPATCSSTCTTEPCYVVTNVGNCDLTTPTRTGCIGFDYGSRNRVLGAGACSGDPGVYGPDSIFTSVTVSGNILQLGTDATCTVPAPPPP